MTGTLPIPTAPTRSRRDLYAEWEELDEDRSLSDTAARLGRYMARWDGEREYRAEELAAQVHGGPSNATVWRHVRQLELALYVECVREQAGKGRGKWYRWIPREKRGAIRIARQNSRGNGGYPDEKHDVNGAVGGTLGGGQSSTAPEDVVVDVAEVACEAVKAMNRGMAKNPAAVAAGYRPVLPSHGASVQQTADWLREGIPPPVLVELVEVCARQSTAGRVSSLKYFAAQVSGAYAGRVAEQEARAGPGPPVRRGPPPGGPNGRRIIDEQVYATTTFEGFNR